MIVSMDVGEEVLVPLVGLDHVPSTYDWVQYGDKIFTVERVVWVGDHRQEPTGWEVVLQVRERAPRAAAPRMTLVEMKSRGMI